VRDGGRRYRVGVARRVANALMTAAIRIGIAPRNDVLLTTIGRTSGAARTTPVTIVDDGAGRWLVAPYGAVGWVHNARAAGVVALRRGRRVERYAVEEVPPEVAAAPLKAYLTAVPIVRPFFDVTPRSSLDEFAAEAPRHPVFRLVAPDPASA